MKRLSPIALATTAALMFTAAPLMTRAQEPQPEPPAEPAPAPAEHSAFGPRHTSTFEVDAEVPDIPKLEAKAVDILRTKYGMTLEEAREKVRFEGKTNVARCLEYVYTNALESIVQADVIGVRIGNQHPEGAP